MKTKLWRLFPLLLLVLVGLVVWQGHSPQGDGRLHVMKCPDVHKGCRMDLSGASVAVSMVGELKPLQAFLVRVEAPHADKVEARFTMEGMDMGFNLYTLRADKDGVFESSITLPVCVTGRRDWIMELSLDGERLAVPFVTDL
ncbi:MAG: hypothetical protein H6935_09005 [Thiobacillus sp.]|nr:hypothetical protein [Thiobacillus sp.]